MSSIPSFEMNQVNSFPGHAVPFPLNLHSKLSIEFETAFEAILLTNPGKLTLEKVIARSVTTCFT